MPPSPKESCKFLRINDMDLSELTQYVFHSLGYPNPAVQTPRINGNTITFFPEQPYYRTHVCVSKTSKVNITEAQTVVCRSDGDLPRRFLLGSHALRISFPASDVQKDAAQKMGSSMAQAA